MKIDSSHFETMEELIKTIKMWKETEEVYYERWFGIDEMVIMANEIERLTELCNKYEEEHKTTFETWQRDIKENELLHSIIKEVREYIEALKIEDYDSNAYFIQDKYDKWLGIEEIPNKLLEILDKVEENK